MRTPETIWELQGGPPKRCRQGGPSKRRHQEARKKDVENSAHQKDVILQKWAI